ncbi:MAG TPA: class I SAM-dependent methyltransferase [Dehalococcoidia bacterium]|nr:class I SAM-dependent methyltransferase [Dehalococcoidia bacterium]
MAGIIKDRINRSNLIRVISNPLFGVRELYALNRFSRNEKPLREFLVIITKASVSLITELLNEAEASPLYASVFDVLKNTESTSQGEMGNISESDWLLLYTLARLIKPETGVASGISTTAILSALQKNEMGRLYSIDLPLNQIIGRRMRDGRLYDRVYEGKKTGWLVPEYLKNQWELLLGDVRDVLEPLLNQLRNIDIFFHDDLHTPNHMFWELKLVWPYLNSGGVIVSDDINYGWVDFIRSIDTSLSPYLHHNLLGLVRK